MRVDSTGIMGIIQHIVVKIMKIGHAREQAIWLKMLYEKCIYKDIEENVYINYISGE